MPQPTPPPQPPYYAVIFTNQRNEGDDAAYSKTAERMTELATRQPGFLGIDSTRSEDGFGITVSYWQSLEAISDWKRNSEHEEARRQGNDVWYQAFSLHISRVERSYEGP